MAIRAETDLLSLDHRADPEWAAVVAKTEKDGQLVESISNQLLAPTAFSAVK